MPVAVEEDLDAVEIPEDDYLCELVERAPALSSLLKAMRDLPTFWGIVEFATDPGKAQPDMLAKVEAELLLSQEHVDWESFHTRLLRLIFVYRAEKKSAKAKKISGMTDERFKLYHELARTFPAFLEHAGKDKRATNLATGRGTRSSRRILEFT